MPDDGATETRVSSASTTAAAEVMKTNLSSSPRLFRSPKLGPDAPISTVACSDEPTLPSLRKASICLFTCSRAARMPAHFASSASSGASNCQNVSMKIDSLLPKKPQASSAVKLRKGAIQRSRACVRCHSAVWALRRSGLLGAVV